MTAVSGDRPWTDLDPGDARNMLSEVMEEMRRRNDQPADAGQPTITLVEDECRAYLDDNPAFHDSVLREIVRTGRAEADR